MLFGLFKTAKEIEKEYKNLVEDLPQDYVETKKKGKK